MPFDIKFATKASLFRLKCTVATYHSSWWACRLPSNLWVFQDLVKRTPSTSAIYETLRRSKELRESLSRPSSRLSCDNGMEKMGKDVVRPTIHQKSYPTWLSEARQ